jgi:putative ABC transport system ATP-binding protein
MTAKRVKGAEVLLTEVTKHHPVGRGEHLVAADAVTLAIPAGGTVALVGPSGSGKSTLLHLMGAMDRATSGTVTVDEVDLASLPPRRLAAYRRTVGFVFQRFHLLPALNVMDNVLAPLLPVRTPFDKRARAQELLAAVGLAGRERALPSRLSGGEQQRVAIARALVTEPRLLLADEPTGNLDSATGAEILDLLFTLPASSGTTIVLATHDPHAASRCDRMVRLRDGAVVSDTDLADAPPADDLLTDIDRFRP